ncbi:MAG: hypothetical protein IKI21_12650 [Oscillospiraceae bacterium]|nr:hypothetical protein [Oscillospiraceae bacterium]
MSDLTNGSIKVIDSEGTEVTIKALISNKGGQGDVYRAVYKGKDYALKWYKGEDDVIGGVQYENIQRICGIGKRPNEKFIWPLLLVTEEDPKPGKCFGYLMELIPDGYHEMSDFLRRDDDPDRVRFCTYNALLMAGMHLASRMQALHLRGYSYKDLNPNNLCIHPETGDVLIVDNDNVSADRTDRSTVIGMRGYMAPEIVRSRSRIAPSTSTDRYSLAVVLYRLFFIDHPMEGRLWKTYEIIDDRVKDYFYAIKPVFHFDPENDENRPEGYYAQNAAARWRIYPIELRELFTRAFTKGISAPGARPPENEWIKVIARCRDRLIRFRDGREQFVDLDVPQTIPPLCVGLRIGKERIALFDRKGVCEISITGDSRRYDRMEIGVDFTKRGPYISNLSPHTWRCILPNGQERTLSRQDQKGMLMVPGMKIMFREGDLPICGEIYAPQ